MTSHDPPARSAPTISPQQAPTRPRGRRVAILLAAAVPLAAAALATTAGPVAADPKLPPFRGD